MGGKCESSLDVNLRANSRAVVVSRRPESRSSFITSALKLWSLLDAFGLLLMGTGFTLILLPFTLYTTATGGFRNRKRFGFAR